MRGRIDVEETLLVEACSRQAWVTLSGFLRRCRNDVGVRKRRIQIASLTCREDGLLRNLLNRLLLKVRLALMNLSLHRK